MSWSGQYIPTANCSFARPMRQYSPTLPVVSSGRGPSRRSRPVPLSESQSGEARAPEGPSDKRALQKSSFSEVNSGCDYRERFQTGSQASKSASENTTAVPRRRRGRAPLELPDQFGAVLDDYIRALAAAPLAAQTRRTYTSKVRQFLAWLAIAALDEDPLSSAAARDWAVRDYRTHLQSVLKRSPATVNNALAARSHRQSVLKRSPATVNNALAAVDDFYIRRGLGPASAARIEIAAAAPRALDARAQLRYLRAVQRCPSPRDLALALVPFYAGARISEIVALDLDDVARSARKGVLQILGKDEAPPARSARNLQARLLHPPRRGRMRSARKLAARGARADDGLTPRNYAQCGTTHHPADAARRQRSPRSLRAVTADGS